MKIRWFVIGIASAAAIALGIFATSLFSTPTPTAEPTSSPTVTREGETGVIKVATSTNVWASVIETIGGDWVEVTSIINDPLQDPHSYEASARDQLAIQDAELVVANGGGYDEFMEVLVAASEGDKIFLELVEGGHSHTDDAANHEGEQANAEEAHADEHAHEHGNEHIWYDFELVAVAAGHIVEAITELRPEAFDEVNLSYDAFIQDLRSLEDRLEGLNDRKMVSSMIALEGVGNLMLEHAGFEDLTPADLADAIEEEREVPAAAIERAKELISGNVAGLLVVNAQMLDQVSDELIKAAEASNVPVVKLSELIPEEGMDYYDWMNQVLDQLQEAVY